MVKDSHRSGMGTCLTLAGYKMHICDLNPSQRWQWVLPKQTPWGPCLWVLFAQRGHPWPVDETTEAGGSGCPNPREDFSVGCTYYSGPSPRPSLSWPPLWSPSHLSPSCRGHLCMVRGNTCETGASIGGWYTWTLASVKVSAASVPALSQVTVFVFRIVQGAFLRTVGVTWGARVQAQIRLSWVRPICVSHLWWPFPLPWVLSEAQGGHWPTGYSPW